MLLTDVIDEVIDNIASNVVVLSGEVGGPVGSAIQDGALNVFLRNQGGREAMARISRDVERVTRKVENNSQMSEHIKQLDYDHIGPSVSVGSFSDFMLNNVTAICRRRFKKKDVIAFVDIEEGEDYEAGIIFTESGIIHWADNGEEIESVEYNTISDVDYDDNTVYIKSGNSTMEINLGDDAEDEKYPRYMYNFIMDIVDYINGEYENDEIESFEECEVEEG